MKSEFTLAFNEIAEHSKLKREIILEALETAMVQAYRKAVNASTAQHVVAKIDPATGAIRVYAEKEVVEDVLEPHTEVKLADAHEVDPEAKLGDMVTVEATPKDFGRIAAQAAKQVIVQKIREAERESQYQEYAQREGDIVNGVVQSITAAGITLGLGRTEAQLPRSQMMMGERYRAHDKVRAYVLEVKKSTRGPQIIVSRSHKNMLRRLLEYEVPEIYNGAVEIKSIAREAGHRSKVAVAALQDGVDPVGACVGMRGVRIQSIVKELNDEKIDVIEWNPEQSIFIAKSLSPARVTAVYLDDDPIRRTAMVVVPDDQLSLAIGREGQNARLAAKLTGWRIDIKSLSEAAAESFKRLKEDAAFADVVQASADMLALAEGVLARKAEGKPITPEEYKLLGGVVDLLEKKVAKGRAAEHAAKAEQVQAIKATIPAGARKMPLSALPLSEKMQRLLADADFKTVGDVLEQLALDEDRILGLEGFGPKLLEELKTAVAGLTFPDVVDEPEPAPAPESETAAEAAAPAAEVAAPAGEQPALTNIVVEPETEEEEFADKDAPESADDKKPGKKKGKKKAATEIVFDEDLGIYVTRKLRKPGRAGELDVGLSDE